MKDTRDIAYTKRLNTQVWWKRLLDVQRPYRYNLSRLELGQVLDVGCGVGRNLRNLQSLGIPAVGVDHNEHSIKSVCDEGFTAFVTTDFHARYSDKAGVFDSMLVSHVLEHMSRLQAVSVLQTYLPYLKPEAKLVLITPQEAGFASDPTHIEFMDFDVLRGITEALGFTTSRKYSFPFPRLAGRLFKYNEFVVVGERS